MCGISFEMWEVGMKHAKGLQSIRSTFIHLLAALERASIVYIVRQSTRIDRYHNCGFATCIFGVFEANTARG